MQINTLIQRGFGSLPGIDRIASSYRPDPTDRTRPAPLPQDLRSSAVTRVTRDQMEFSAEARAAATLRGPVQRASDPSAVSVSATADSDLSEEQRTEVQQLRQTDREVRAHEQAHKAAAGRYGGSISFDYTTGPDGKRYATSGSVPIDSSPVEGDPDATIRKMQQVHAAAVAPADPSPADRNIAASAQRHLNEARREKLDQERDTSESAAGEASSASRAPSASDANPAAILPSFATPTTPSNRVHSPSTKAIRSEGTTDHPSELRDSARATTYSPAGASRPSTSTLGRALDRLA